MIFQAIFPLVLFKLSSAAEWNYAQYASDWYEDFPTCNGSSQSPINIDHETLVQADYSDFSFSVGYKIVQEGTLENNGHTLQFAVDESYAASISGGPLMERYILNQFHLHWGSQTGQGSEHTVDGESFDAELHLVHYKSTYDNISAAVKDGQPDSLAVVGIFIREATTWDQWRGAKDSDSVNHLRMAALELSKNWKGPAAPSAQMEVVMDQFLSGITDLSGIYHYEGSLTTPGCDEIVQWIVMDTPLYIRSNGLITALKKNLDNHGDALQDNYRPPQAVNGRTVYHFSRDDAAAPAAAPVQLSLGDACDPSNVTGICSSGTRCQNVSWVEYTDSGNGEYSDFVDASISHGLKYEYYVDHVEGYICTTDCFLDKIFEQNECTDNSQCCSGYCAEDRTAGKNLCTRCRPVTWRSNTGDGSDCCSKTKDSSDNCECAPADAPCFMDNQCCTGLTCTGSPFGVTSKDRGHYGICG